jgi:hypothetical protein
VALSPATGCLSIGPVLPGFQDGKREWLRAKDIDTKMEIGMPGYYSDFS